MPVTADYIRIADGIIADIKAKTFVPGDKLPSISQLATAYKVSPSTIKQAYIRLEALRVIWRHQGKGVFIADPALWTREP